jgi:hypothetical protein
MKIAQRFAIENGLSGHGRRGPARKTRLRLGGVLLHFFESQLAGDDFLESDIGEGGFWGCFDEGAMAEAKLTDALGDDVDEELLVGNYFGCFLQELSGHISQGTDGTARLRWKLQDILRSIR